MNIKQLREVAQAATPGPWDYVANGAGLPRNRVGVTMKDSIGDGYSSRCVALVCAIDDFDDIEPNAAHIAAFNPELILRLLDVVEAAQGINNGDVSKYDEYWRDLEAAIKALGG